MAKKHAESVEAPLEPPAAPAPTWGPPEDCVVSEDRTLFILVGGVRYEHVSEAPDGRWVYRRS